MKIESFAGVFQFNGAARRFALVDGELRLGPFDVNEASGVVAAIEDRSGVQPVAHPNHVEEDRTRREVEAPAKPKRTKAAAAVEPPKPEPVPTKAVEVEDEGIPFGKPESVPEVKPASEAKPAGGNGSAPDLVNAKRLVDLIIAIQEQGITETAAIVAECERLRSTVPLLDRIPDMHDRVERALLTLGQ